MRVTRVLRCQPSSQIYKTKRDAPNQRQRRGGDKTPAKIVATEKVLTYFAIDSHGAWYWDW